MNIKDLYIQSYIRGGNLAKKEARIILPPTQKFRELIRTRLIPLDQARLRDFHTKLPELSDIIRRFKKFDPVTWQRRLVIPGNLLETGKDLVLPEKQANWLYRKSFLRAIKAKPELYDYMSGHLDNSYVSENLLRSPLRRYLSYGKRHKLIQLKNDPKYLYRGTYANGNPLKGQKGDPNSPVMSERSYMLPDGDAVWLTPYYEAAQVYGPKITRFEIPAQMQDFVKRTSTNHQGISVSLPERLSGNAHQRVLAGEQPTHGGILAFRPDYEVVLTPNQLKQLKHTTSTVYGAPDYVSSFPGDRFLSEKDFGYFVNKKHRFMANQSLPYINHKAVLKDYHDLD